MITAIVVAGGVGKRMGQEIPKQFIMVDNKPILIYTLESFDKHPLVDQVLVVCKEGWEETLWGYIKEFGLKKVKWIIQGGSKSQESINNGVQFLKTELEPTDIVVIHDGIRPLVDELVLSDVIIKAKKHGNAVTSLPYNEQIFIKETEETTTQYINRETLRRVSTPQAYKFEKLTWAYEKAFRENIGITDSSYTNTMMVDLGERLYFALGSDKNIKLTTPDDLELFKGFLRMKGE
ncbi:2-C-methyl-D-erythritol 4-phosphate cytidylyltransferase [Vagococcus sp. BWB3-3]|uniref:2-C-methyl-D-erythritol 4-phosphate cytidylyltransferase n=1 Tax=Vagococcus allomyrinae TaxID=2794353 RepID=A0A940SYR5_9ENTE|nr:IspD/TarI family cytidylyltransferase [Vagococcus allomyrinae]MBP1043663.1 2-C-methyl-D-erythritol 4-phosphate cytidylyltransferase [Vagococcus allomyrinae]